MTTDWRKAGQLADATRVQNLMRTRYDGPAKRSVRNKMVAMILKSGASTVLDFHGGGRSAEALTAAGLRVISVENGSSLPDGVSKLRLRRSVALVAPNVPYDLRWGNAVKAAPECDAAFLDFCGHYSPAMGQLLRACRHMKIIVVTVMPERTPLGRLTAREWNVALASLLMDAADMKLQTLTRYHRKSGLGAILIALSKQGYFARYRAFEYQIIRRKDPQHRARKAARAATPEARARAREYQAAYQERVKADPEWSALERERAMLRSRALRLDPIRRAAFNIYQRDRARKRYQEDPEYRAHRRALSRAASARKRAARLDAAAHTATERG